MKKIRIGVVFGGRSSEHLVSIRSAASVFANLSRDRYDPVALYILPQGRWIVPDRQPAAQSEAEAKEYMKEQEARQLRTEREAHLVAYPNGHQALLTIERRLPDGESDHDTTVDSAVVHGMHLDVVFPVLHGPFGEDGTVQGLLELANLPYVGAGVLASSVGMDKAVMKTLFAARGLPTAAYVVIKRRDWLTDRERVIADLMQRFALPVFVKPANLGSSVGISKAKDRAGLEHALDLAAQYDRKLVIEAAVPNAREIEVAVLGNDRPEASVPGEIIPSREFYDYEAKYLDEGTTLKIPAALSPEQTAEVRRLAVEAFLAVDAAGLGRIDFLLDGKSGEWFVSEINTIPGFTTISMYPKLWEATGLRYAALIDGLIDLAIERHAEKQDFRTTVS
ncbi:MAG: D-alanine--D-alanine ligase [Acidobacteria bacterium]|nr:D-alanine--D-alanine ligase [Acidobacteriota bacterium]